ncbi:hypothetical protein MPER_07534 [Moniliophthora perniciosa FA553]|nr:hypothetical protein MPER_07534 [Moniliophthora perniciosa FA553]
MTTIARRQSCIRISPRCLRIFENWEQNLFDDLAPGANVTTNVAKEQKTHYIDLHGTSLKYCEAIGEAACHRLNAKPTDTTHINPHGAVVFGSYHTITLMASLLTEPKDRV